MGEELNYIQGKYTVIKISQVFLYLNFNNFVNHINQEIYGFICFSYQILTRFVV